MTTQEPGAARYQDPFQENLPIEHATIPKKELTTRRLRH